jgi:tripartite-type tricarboxylate transporter receptor subunit TctC
VPFREANGALSSLMTGDTQMTFALVSIAQAQIKAGTVRGLGVTSRLPSQLAPDLPSIAQAAGLPDFEVVGWNGYVAPKGTPTPVIAKLSAAIKAGLDDADLRQRLVAAGYEPVAKSTPQEFAGFIAADIAKWRDLVDKTNMKAN